ncbi:MAG: NlpC/P60 family protein [Bacteroidota bacterium]|nr:NlpC/P60 family protein [Bacteroidota bacterium]
MNKTILFLFCILSFSIIKTKNVSAQSTNRVNAIIDSIQKCYAPDKRVAVFKIKAYSQNENSFTLTGETSLPDAQKAILEKLHQLSLHVTDSIEILPQKALGDNTFGLVTLSVANLRFSSDHAAEMASQALMGTPLRVLKQDENWFLVQTPDKYIGWMEECGVARMDKARIEKWKRAHRIIFTEMNGFLYSKADKKSTVVSDLTLGDILEVTAKTKTFVQVNLPDGRTGFVSSEQCKDFDQWKKIRPDSDKIIQTALKFMGLPYLWGGLSAKATDCSGLVKTVYFMNGIILDRDASQQVYNGQIIPAKVDSIQPCDLLFFGRINHVTHVGMYIGKGKYIHSSGLVRVNSLDPSSPSYISIIRKSFVSASRILTSIGTKGIIRVENHPWYTPDNSDILTNK